MNQKMKIQTLLDNTPFPGAGQSIGGHYVTESVVDLQGKNWGIYIRGKLSAQEVKQALKQLTSTHFALPVQDKYSLVSFAAKGMTHARTNPPGDVTIVRGHMYYARPNPISPSQFDKEMDEMLIDNPEKHFTKYTVKNKDQLHERLWKGVTYAGEAYGWQKGDDLWHRRASFIMPKIKINKALKGATMFYHTHPAKDEPSLTSADDIQFYLDLHFRWGINDFYTVMKHKLDYFKITGKKGGKEKYLRMEEDAFIDAIDGLIEEGEEVAKKEVSEDSPDIDFQNRITKEMVDRFNKKFSNIAKISFRPRRKNSRSKLAKKSASPLSALLALRPNPPIRVEDKYVAKALEELKGLDYAHEHYGADEYGHTMYVYWWLKHHLAPTTKQPKGRLFKLNEYGLDSDTRKKLRQYLSQPVIGNYNNMDVVYLLALYHDIAKLREKNAKEPGWEIGAEMFRKEIGPELKLPDKLTEDLTFLLNTDLGRKGITDTDFLPQAGDYYGACKLVHMADMITHHPTMYTKQGGEAYKQEAMVQMIDQLRDFLDHNYVLPNPPPKVTTLKWISSYGLINLAMEEVEELLGEFHQSVVPDEDGNLAPPGDRSSGGHLYSMRFNAEVVPGLSRPYKANFALSSSNLNITVGKPVPEDLGKQDANLIYQAVGERLKESYPDIDLEPVEPEVVVNPRHAGKLQIILISGPSGGGKSTVLKYLHRHLPDSSIPPTYTTRPRRPTDGPDRKFVTKATFKKMIEQGKLVEYVVSGNGHYYGRVFDDFEGKYAIVEVTLQGKKHYEARFPNVFSIYLDPDPRLTEKDRAKAIFRRGGLSKEEAKRRAKVATENVKKSKKVNFDLRVTMKKGNYLDGARRVLHNLPLNNPSQEDEDEEEETPKRLSLDDFGLDYKPPTGRTYLGKEFVQAPTTQPELDEVGIDTTGVMESDFLDRKEAKRRERKRKRQIEAQNKKDENQFPQSDLPFDTVQLNEEEEEENPPKDLFDWFEEWSELINMKNKEMKAFMKSPWFKVAGLTPAEAKKMGIKSGQNSFRAIIRMRKKLGLTGPKDYIDYRKPRTVEAFYAKAVDKWNQTDWDWCKTQVRFNKRHSGFPYNKAKESTKGPLIKKQKTQNQPSRRLLGLWVWAHDPWRWARKQGIANMPKCPDVPWVGMTEKRKYGKLEVINGPSTRSNPPPPGIAMFPGELHQGPAALYQQTISISQLNPPRSKPFPWNKARVKKSPFKTMKQAKTTYASWKAGNVIGSTATSSLKSMGKIPRVSGKYELGEKYARMNPPLNIYHSTSRPKTNPVIESGIPGVRMAYMEKPSVFGSEYNWDSEIIEASKHERGLIGEDPITSTSRYLYNEEKDDLYDWTKVVNVGKVVRMSPNDYFDLLTAGGYGIPERSAKVRWPDKGIDYIMSIVAGLKNGQVMTMPTINHSGTSQEGGHRMEALRQMGHADTPVPVMYLHDEERTVSDANPEEEIFIGPHGALTETEFFRKNPHGGAHRIPKKYEGQPMDEHSDLFTDEDKENTIKGLGFKDKATAIKSVNIIKRSGKTHAHKIQAAMAMEQRARFHAHQTPGIKAAQKVYAKFIEEMKKKTKEMRKNPPKISHYPDPDPESPKDMQRIDLHEEGKNIGFLLWYRKDDKIWLELVKVSPAHRGKNLGRLLINELLSKTKGERIHLASKEHLVQWYESMGFKLLEGDTNEMVLQNPSRTPGGKKVPTRYLKGLTKLEKMIAEDEIDKGYKYDVNDPEAYKFWQSDIKATARGLKIGSSKHRDKYYKIYRKNIDKDYKPSGKTSKQKFLNRIRKETKIKKSILEKIYSKGLAAWRTGHRPGVQQHQWAAGRVYAFVVGADSSTGPGKPDHKLAVEAGVR
jgi:guanylate kinase